MEYSFPPSPRPKFVPSKAKWPKPRPPVPPQMCSYMGANLYIQPFCNPALNPMRRDSFMRHAKNCSSCCRYSPPPNPQHATPTYIKTLATKEGLEPTATPERIREIFQRIEGKPAVVLDIESTGLCVDGRKDEVMDMCCIPLNNTAITWRSRCKNSIPCTPEAQSFHKLAEDPEAPRPKAFFLQFFEFLTKHVHHDLSSIVLICYGNLDAKFLQNSANVARVVLPPFQWENILEASKYVMGRYKKLKTFALELGVHMTTPHQAVDDTQALLGIVLQLKQLQKTLPKTKRGRPPKADSYGKRLCEYCGKEHPNRMAVSRCKKALAKL